MSRPIHVRVIFTGAIVALLCGAFGACTKTRTVDNTSASGRTVVQILQSSFSVSLFNAALNYTGLADSLSGSGPYTIFAPGDAAFDSMGIHTVAQIDTMDKAKLTHLLKYHILYGQQVRLEDVDQKPNNPFTSWDGLTLYVSRPYNTTSSSINNNDLTYFMTVNGDTVVQDDILATNGVIHTLNHVLKYQQFNTCADFLSADTNYSYFVAALKNFNLYSQLQSAGPLTVFAPMNSAFTSMGIDLDSLNRLDTLHFIKLLFQPYICPSLRFFMTDLLDFTAPFVYYPPGNGYTVSITQGQINFTGPLVNFIGAVGLDPVTHDQIPLIPVPGWLQYPAAIVDIDHPAGNGVVQGINSLIAVPSFCQIHQ